MADMALLREKLQKMDLEPGLIEELCLLFEKMYKFDKEEQHAKQMKGIERAREMGKTLGRPKIKEPDNFFDIVKAWEDGSITAPEAAGICSIGVSTFYRRVRGLKDNHMFIDKEGETDDRK